MMIEDRDNGLKLANPDAIRIEWLDRLHTLAAQVRGWVEKHGWRTRLVAKPVRDEPLGRFEVPLLLMERNAVQVALSPITRFPGNSDGGVDLYVVPAYSESASLSLEDDQWFLYYSFDRSSGANDQPEPARFNLDEPTLITALDLMVARDAESL